MYHLVQVAGEEVLGGDDFDAGGERRLLLLLGFFLRGGGRRARAGARSRSSLLLSSFLLRGLGGVAHSLQKVASAKLRGSASSCIWRRDNACAAALTGVVTAPAGSSEGRRFFWESAAAAAAAGVGDVVKGDDAAVPTTPSGCQYEDALPRDELRRRLGDEPRRR